MRFPYAKVNQKNQKGKTWNFLPRQKGPAARSEAGSSEPAGISPRKCRDCIGKEPNPHHVLMMSSSRNISAVLDSPVPASLHHYRRRDKQTGEVKCLRRALPLIPSCTCASSCGYRQLS